MKPALWISEVYKAFLEDGGDNAVYRHLNVFFSRDYDLISITSLLPITQNAYHPSQYVTSLTKGCRQIC